MPLTGIYCKDASIQALTVTDTLLYGCTVTVSEYTTGVGLLCHCVVFLRHLLTLVTETEWVMLEKLIDVEQELLLLKLLQCR